MACNVYDFSIARRHNFFVQSWDRSYYLENLSGTETDCAMIGRPYHNWAKTEMIAFKDMGLRVTGISGSAVNRGETEPAVEEIIYGVLGKMKVWY